MEDNYKLNLGCGDRHIHGFINIDGREEVKPDFCLDITKISNSWNGTADLITAFHVLEHFPYKPLSFSKVTVKDVLRDWYKALKPKGELYLSVPNFQAICDHYLINKDLRSLQSFLIGGQKYDFDQHYSVWDYDSLSEILMEVGFDFVGTYNWKKTEWFYIDSYEQCYLPHMDKVNGKMMSLNLMAIKGFKK